MATVVTALKAQLKTLELDARGRTLAATALVLAQQLDDGAGMATAAVSKELRAVLAELVPERDGDSADAFIQSLRAPVLHATN